MANPETLTVEEVPVPSTPSAAGSAGIAQSGRGVDWLAGISLRQATEILGGYQGTLVNPATGVEHPVSLAQFEGRDLDATFVRILIKFVDPKKVGTVRPNH